MFILVFVLIVFSCKKSSNDTSNAAVKYCRVMEWSNTSGQSGSFTGSLVNGQYSLTQVQYYNSSDSVWTVNFARDANHNFIDGPEITFNYNQNSLTKITLIGRVGAGIYIFDNNGHLTNGNVVILNGTTSSTVTATYTYDSNEDPVNISAHGITTTEQGTMTSDIEITGTFLEDKASLLPFIPTAAPFTSHFSVIPFLSKHLLSSWNITINGTTNGDTIPTLHINIYYIYTYDSSGNVATMVNTANPNIIYSFTYSGCN